MRPDKTADMCSDKTTGMRPDKAAGMCPDKAAGMRPDKTAGMCGFVLLVRSREENDDIISQGK